MIAYIDTSALLRVVLGQPDVLPEWPNIERGVSSRLIATESLRTLDRLRLRTLITDADLTMATHDRALALATQAHGLPIAGISKP